MHSGGTTLLEVRVGCHRLILLVTTLRPSSGTRFFFFNSMIRFQMSGIVLFVAGRVYITYQDFPCNNGRSAKRRVISNNMEEMRGAVSNAPYFLHLHGKSEAFDQVIIRSC